MKKLIGNLLINVGKSIPAINSARKIIADIRQKKAVDIQKLIWFAVELGSVVVVLWICKHFGVTIDQIFEIIKHITTLGLF